MPLALKNHGRFEAALIRAVSPALARYPSDYGHAFDAPVPLSRLLRDHATLLRPPWLRRRMYRLRYRRRAPWPEFLGPEALSRVLDPSLPRMSEYMHVSRVNDPALFARLATLEYLFTRLGT